MEIKRCVKETFYVIGKEGSTSDGINFIQNLWNAANSHYNEVEHLSKKNKEGNPVGFWGAMSDISRTFKPWEDNFSKGLYLAGTEVYDNAMAPENWTKWTIPGYEYLCVKVENDGQDTFNSVLKYMADSNLHLAGAVNDFICPEENGQLYMYFPIKKL